MESGIRLGCSQLSPSEYSQSVLPAELSEVDLPTYASWSPSERKKIQRQVREGHQVIGSCSSAWIQGEGQLDRRMVLEELCGELQISQLIIRVQVRHLNELWPKYPFVDIFLDHPKMARDSVISGLLNGRIDQVWDPMWDHSGPDDLHSEVLVKIHGWHDVRWVRRYSVAQIHDCMSRVSLIYQRAKTQVRINLLLAHSQKREQLELFQNALAERSRFKIR